MAIPIELELSFRVDFLPTWTGYRGTKYGQPVSAEEQLALDEVERRGRAELYASFGLKFVSGAWAEVTLDADKAQRIVARMQELTACGQAKLASGWLSELCRDDRGAEWFTLRGAHAPDKAIDHFGDYPTCRADRLARGTHLIDDLRTQVVSERFRAIVERSGLRGLEFLWLRDIGRYAAPQLYYAIATAPMTGGKYHPWFGCMHGEDASGQGDPGARAGGYVPGSFEKEELRAVWTTGEPAIDRLLSVFPRDAPDRPYQGLRIAPLRRFARGALPDTDFAYDWNRLDVRRREGVVRWRRLCVSRRARDILVEAGVALASHFEAVVVTDDREGDLHAAPPPAFAPAELAALRKQEATCWKAHLAKRRPERKVTLEGALKCLRRAKRERPDNFRAGLPASKHEQLVRAMPIRLPEALLAVFRVSNGFLIDWPESAGCNVPQLDEVAALHARARQQRLDVDEDYADVLVYFAESCDGDFYALRPEPSADGGDCAVLLLSHEGYSIDRQWATIPEFIESVLVE